ncbi:uncharacterized protein LOC107274657 isoform X2 [Cephus cinctus]|uniref:Uncharacterized protein LOC107274657 isoform X2 n=1 Tax=Cephus cinctus TaxID=211228 RepID=A0AAJ7FUU6_CEPCN|nr:uncharacterized protein LOC107274657 isoform X2 [Cephus cinctus]
MPYPHQGGHNNTAAQSGDRPLGRMAQMGGRAITRNRTGTISTRERGTYVRGLHINILTLPALVLKFYYLRVVHRCASCIMGMFKWLKKDIVLRDRNRRNLPPENNDLNNEAYRNALQAFIDRRRNPNEPGGITLDSPEKTRLDIFIKNTNNTNNDKKDDNITIPGVPHIPAPEVFEIGWVAGTEDRYLELIFAEWQNTRVSLKRHTHPECQNAIKADLKVLTEIRHPNILLLMATTQTDDHGLVTIFEPVDCTLYNYIHEQGERISVQSVAKCSGKLADALRHAHMRGYIHGALSSHCVYLASGGNVKLGGWELSVTEDNSRPDREYESRLRAEIFRWQAPELFRGHAPSKQSDVYGLALLIWEMCTMRMPWNGFSEPDVKRQFVHWDRGVMTDFYKFPPLLNNLLEAGLQVDVTKRTLDMNRMRRFLQRLELQYEAEDAMYIDHCTNNNNSNNQRLKGQNGPVSGSSTTNVSSSAKYTEADTPKTSRIRKQRNPEKIMSNRLRDPASNKKLHLGRVNLFLDVRNVRGTEQGHKITNMFAEAQKNNNEVNTPKGNLNVVSDLQRNNDSDDVRGWSFTETIEADGKNVNETYSIVGCDSSSSVASTFTGAINSAEEDAQSALKKLKESLASKRENFFYGNNASQISIPETISPTMRIKILEEAKNKDCEPHKPASHKTSFELKMNKSPTTIESILTKPASHKNQKSPYSSIPRVIKESIFQPQTLNTDSQSFFESSLWRKEKLICLSKMSPSPPHDNGSRNPTGMDNNKTNKQLECPKNTERYTINSTTTGQTANETQILNGNSTLAYDDLMNKVSLEYSNSKDESIRTLKNALNRATNIVSSETSNPEDTSSFSPTKTLNGSEITLEDIKAREAMFEDMYRLTFDNTSSDIRSIERETEDNRIFMSITKPSSLEDYSSGSSKDEDGNQNFLSDKETAQCGSYEHSNTNFVCESIAETSLEDDSSARNEERPNAYSGESDNTVTIRRTSLPQMVNSRDDRTESSTNEPSVHESNYTFLFITDKTRENACQSCNNKNALTRRRSLPAGLGHLKTMNSNNSLGKLPIRKVDVPHNPSDDIYFDDDFGDKLSVNMVLMDDEVRRDDDFLPEILNLSNPCVYT